jgi:hypothetical protein
MFVYYMERSYMFRHRGDILRAKITQNYNLQNVMVKIEILLKFIKK